MYLEPGALGQIIDRPAATIELRAPVYRGDPRLRAALVTLLDRLERCASAIAVDRADLLACDEALAEIGGLLPGRMIHGAPAAVERAADMRAVRERLADELLDPSSLAELAAMVGMSRFQLVRQFKRAHGLPPYRWLLMQRAQLARRRIGTGASLAQAAIEAGFADQSHMSRTFMRCFGFTPGAWRQAVGRGAGAGARGQDGPPGSRSTRDATMRRS